MRILNIGTRICNNYVLQTPVGLIVVDTGYPGGFQRFKTKLGKEGLRLSDIKFIVLTHAHDDHAGFLNELLDCTDAPVVLHQKAIARLAAGQNNFNGGCSTRTAWWFCKAMTLVGKGSHRFPVTIRPERYFVCSGSDDEQYLQAAGIEATIVSLPGHTADSIGLLLPDGVILCGDAAMSGLPSKANHTIWMESIAEYQLSWRRMLSCGAKTVFPGHGKPFEAQKLKANLNFMNGKRLLRLQEKRGSEPGGSHPIYPN